MGNMKKIIFAIIPIIAGLGVFGIAYSQTLSCIPNVILHLIKLDEILRCLEDRIVVLENQPSSSENTSASSKLIGQQVGQAHESKLKINIGTTYIDIYDTQFDFEEINRIDFSNVTYVRIEWHWDYVGLGAQQARWVDAENNTNVLFESAVFTADGPYTSNWFPLPSWAVNQTVLIEQQAKSTVVLDTPIAKGYKIMVK